MAPVGVMPAVLGTAGVVYAAVAAAMGLCFVLLAAAVLRSADDGGADRPARQLFGFSILYLFVLFALLIVDRAPGPIGRASCRERVCKYVSIPVVAAPLKKQNNTKTIQPCKYTQ